MRRHALEVRDIVLFLMRVRVRGTDYLHRINAIEGGRFQIGNNRGGINGWGCEGNIFGTATRAAG